jgi:hypothetical protein
MDSETEKYMWFAAKAGWIEKFVTIGFLVNPGPELLELAGYRIGTKAPRSAFNKVNPFNLFLQESKTAENAELRRPAPGRVCINNGRPSFTGNYQKTLAEEYRSRHLLSAPPGLQYQQPTAFLRATGSMSGPMVCDKLFRSDIL